MDGVGPNWHDIVGNEWVPMGEGQRMEAVGMVYVLFGVTAGGERQRDCSVHSTDTMVISLSKKCLS